MLLLCSDPGDAVGLNDSQPGPGADLIGEVHFPALHPNNGFWLPLLPLDPADCPNRGSAGEDKVALKVEIFDFGFSGRKLELEPAALTLLSLISGASLTVREVALRQRSSPTTRVPAARV